MPSRLMMLHCAVIVNVPAVKSDFQTLLSTSVKVVEPRETHRVVKAHIEKKGVLQEVNKSPFSKQIDYARVRFCLVDKVRAVH